MKKVTFLFFILYFILINGVNADVRILSNKYKISINSKHLIVNNIVKIQYDFELANNSNNTIFSFTVGEISVTDNDPMILIPDRDTATLKFSAPANWLGTNDHMPETLLNQWRWSLINHVFEKDALQRNTVTTGFSTVAPSKYPSLFKSFASLDVLGETGSPIIKIAKGDVLAPTGALNSTVVKNQIKKGFFNINISVTAKDNYDPLPEIAFDSIQDVTTSTTGALVSPFSAGYTLNVANDATKGTYPTIITLAADTKVAKKYRIKYKISDASDNQTTVSTIVTIPKQ